MVVPLLLGRHKSVSETVQNSGPYTIIRVSGKAGWMEPLKVPGVPHLSAEKQHGLQAAV